MKILIQKLDVFCKTIDASKIAALGLFFTALGMCLTALAVIIALAAWITQSQQKNFEESQRTLETTFNMNAAWLNVFDTDTRYHYSRVLEAMASTNFAECSNLCRDLAWQGNILHFDSSTFTNHPGLEKLIGQELAAEKCTNSYNIEAQISNYRAAMTRVLNLYDAVAIVRDVARRDNNMQLVEILDEQFWHSITNRMPRLTNLVSAYNSATYPQGDKIGGWMHLMSDLEDHGQENYGHRTSRFKIVGIFMIGLFLGLILQRAFRVTQTQQSIGKTQKVEDDVFTDRPPS